MSDSDVTKVFGIEPETWVWCLHCERAYKVGEHREMKDGLQMCHYAECDGDSVIDACRWEDLREGNPEYPAVLERNNVYPMYNEGKRKV